jgi:hypothetical protein
VSEYQYYEFRAIDRSLTKTEMSELRSISTRAVITSTSFTNHHEWGDLKADPFKLLEKYFDVFVYIANREPEYCAFVFRKIWLLISSSNAGFLVSVCRSTNLGIL